MTGGLSNFGIVTGFAFSGGSTTAPFAAGAAVVALVELAFPFVPVVAATFSGSVGEAEFAGVGVGLALACAVLVVAGGGVPVDCASAQIVQNNPTAIVTSALIMINDPLLVPGADPFHKLNLLSCRLARPLVSSPGETRPVHLLEKFLLLLFAWKQDRQPTSPR